MQQPIFCPEFEGQHQSQRGVWHCKCSDVRFLRRFTVVLLVFCMLSLMMLWTDDMRDETSCADVVDLRPSSSSCGGRNVADIASPTLYWTLYPATADLFLEQATLNDRSMTSGILLLARRPGTIVTHRATPRWHHRTMFSRTASRTMAKLRLVIYIARRG